jgi:hypothetical protein
MTAAERVQTVVEYGFTEREARFLVLVMRHAGVCVRHQYATFAGIANGGDRCNALFAKLVRRGFAVSVPCVHNRARLYHVHYKPLYHAIGEVQSRYRRTVPARAVAERLMRLDAALLGPELEWLTTRFDKLAHLASKTLGSPEPRVQLGEDASDLLPGTFPIGIDDAGRAIITYVAAKPWTDEFQTWLVGHVPFLAVTSTWTLRIVFPSALRRIVSDYQRAVREELETQLDAQTITDLGWYFFHVRRRTDWNEYPSGGGVVKARFARCAQAFNGPRFTRLYRCWLIAREAAFTPVPLPISEALAIGRASVECVVSPHDYEAFSPLVGDGRAHRQRDIAEDREGDKEGEGATRGINRSPNRLLNRSRDRQDTRTASITAGPIR